MAKIMYGNYNDLPWMPNHRKDVDGKVMCYMKCFAMEAANMHTVSYTHLTLPTTSRV